MSMAKGHLEGDAGVITTQGKVGAVSMYTYKNIPNLGVRAKSFVFANGNPFGGATVYVGPVGKALFPLFPPGSSGAAGGSLTLENVNPSLMAIDDRGNESTVYYAYGGESDQDAA